MARHHLSIWAPLLVVALAALGALGCASEQVVEAAKQPAGRRRSRRRLAVAVTQPERSL